MTVELGIESSADGTSETVMKYLITELYRKEYVNKMDYSKTLKFHPRIILRNRIELQLLHSVFFVEGTYILVHHYGMLLIQFNTLTVVEG